MRGRKFHELCRTPLIGLILWLVLFEDGPLIPDFLGGINDQSFVLFHSAKTQWLVLTFLIVYFGVFLLFKSQSSRLFRPLIWLAAMFLVATAAYASDYELASKSTQAITLLGGIGLASGGSLWLAWPVHSHHTNRSIFHVVILLTAILLVGALWQLDTNFAYRGNPRWVGPWNNPNIFGVLMGLAAVLASGLFVHSLMVNVRHRNAQHEIGNWKLVFGSYSQPVVSFFSFLAVVFVGRALLHSYSRGAWLATIAGVCYLTRGMAQSDVGSLMQGKWSGWLQGGKLTRRRIFVVLTSVLVLFFWQFGRTDWQTARRAFSVASTEDFSWRNRIAAWEGALQITAEHPWFGTGWNQPEPLYENYYQPSKLTEGFAIQINDYLMLGATLGIPALFCFGMYVWLTLGGKAESGKAGKRELEEVADVDWQRTVCHAGAIVLLIGFWFDGGLFKLPTAATFWILLELGGQSGNYESGKRK